MRRVSLGRIHQLRLAAQDKIAMHRKIASDEAVALACAAGHAAILAFLARHGNPRVGEPLQAAMERCSKTREWKNICRRFPEWLRERNSADPPFRPDNRLKVAQIGEVLRHWVIATYPGRDQQEKLQRAFSSVPPWLIWFCFGDYTAAKLGLETPDLSGVRKFVRSKENFELWWALPVGAFEKTLWPRGPDREHLARIGSDLLIEKKPPTLPQQLTTREKKRQQRILDQRLAAREQSWPALTPEDVLRMSPRESDARRAAAGRGRFPSANRRLPVAVPNIFDDP